MWSTLLSEEAFLRFPPLAGKIRLACDTSNVVLCARRKLVTAYDFSFLFDSYNFVTTHLDKGGLLILFFVRQSFTLILTQYYSGYAMQCDAL